MKQIVGCASPSEEWLYTCGCSSSDHPRRRNCRRLRGTYVAVEPFHLDQYLSEQVFRHSNRATKDNPLTEVDRFALAVSQVSGKRLTYAELTSKTGLPTF
jgi:hypothetical protein